MSEEYITLNGTVYKRYYEKLPLQKEIASLGVAVLHDESSDFEPIKGTPMRVFFGEDSYLLPTRYEHAKEMLTYLFKNHDYNKGSIYTYRKRDETGQFEPRRRYEFNGEALMKIALMAAFARIPRKCYR